MTTIAATTRMIAADSQVTVDESSYLSPKLMMFEDAAMGAAGDAEACHMFFDWWPKRDTTKLDIPAEMELECLVLTRDGKLYRYGKYAKPDYIRDGLMAVGSGSAIAIASMDTMLHLGLVPDPQIAVAVASKRSPDTGGPIDVFTIEQINEPRAKPVRSRKRAGP